MNPETGVGRSGAYKRSKNRRCGSPGRNHLFRKSDGCRSIGIECGKCTDSSLRDFDKGILYFILEVDGNPIGCVALEQVENNVCYLERLAVHPKYQEQGYGRKLVEFFLEKAKSLGNQKVGIAIIQQHEQLRRWYLKLGFIETTSKQFDHLPFTVQFMELKL